LQSANKLSTLETLLLQWEYVQFGATACSGKAHIYLVVWIWHLCCTG